MTATTAAAPAVIVWRLLPSPLLAPPTLTRLPPAGQGRGDERHPQRVGEAQHAPGEGHGLRPRGALVVVVVVVVVVVAVVVVVVAAVPELIKTRQMLPWQNKTSHNDCSSATRDGRSDPRLQGTRPCPRGTPSGCCRAWRPRRATRLGRTILSAASGQCRVG